MRWKRDVRWIAELQCLACGRAWTAKAGSANCPKCQHVYVKWVNYEALMERYHPKRNAA